MKLYLNTCALVLCLFIALPAVAEESDKFAPIRDKLQLCMSCHGQKGASKQAQYPILAGQHLYYLFVQLQDYKAERRKNSVMTPIAKQLDRDQMMLLAEYFSGQEWPEIDHDISEKEISIGKKIGNSGQCVQCHLGGYLGNSGVPRLAGQHVEYLTKTMLDFKYNRRTNSPSKTSLLDQFTDDELNAMAAYLAGLKAEE